MVFLILELIFSNALKDKPEFELDLLELREGLEEFIEAWLDNPNFLDKKTTEMMEAYEYSRRLDPKLTKYQIAHNNGEDLVLAIDLILSFIVIVKSLTNSSKYLPKFTEWIDEVVENGGKGARALDNTLIEAKYGRIFRIQGGSELPNFSKFRFFIKNDKVLIEGKDMLHITFDDKFRVAQFWVKRGNNAEVFTAEIDVKFIEKIKKEAVPEIRRKEFPDKPQIDDPSKTPNSFGIPNNYFDELLKSMKNPENIKYK